MLGLVIANWKAHPEKPSVQKKKVFIWVGCSLASAPLVLAISLSFPNRQVSMTRQEKNLAINRDFILDVRYISLFPRRFELWGCF